MALTIGDKAPKIKGHKYEGYKTIVFFYPKDNTPGCTAEACNLRDNYKVLQKKGFELVGVSVDDEKSHEKFKTKFDLPFKLIADTEQKTVNDFEVWVEKSMYGRKYMGTARKTFIIDEKGKIEHIIEKVDTKDHANQILALYNK